MEENVKELMEQDNEKRFIRNMTYKLVEITGVERIGTAFDIPYDPHMETIDIIMKYILRVVNFSNINTSPYLFFTRELRFKPSFLSQCGADDPKFYEHSTLEETCENLIMRALRMFGYELSMKSDRNGFPLKFAFDGVVNEFVEKDGIIMYPFFTSRAFNYNKMMNKIKMILGEGEDINNLYFHLNLV